MEDRVVKNFMNEKSNYEPAPSRYFPGPESNKVPSFKTMTKKPISPSDTEVENNIRSRSAKLRAAIRINERVARV